MKSYEQFIETVVNRMVKDALSPQKKTAELELAADAEPSVSDLRKQADMLCRKMDEATEELIAGLIELELHSAQNDTKTAEKQIVSPDFSGYSVPDPPYYDVNTGRVPGPQAKQLEHIINKRDSKLHDKLYANRGAEAGAIIGASTVPPLINMVTPPGMPLVNLGLGVPAGAARAYANNTNALSQQAVKHLLLEDEDSAKKINELIRRAATQKASNTVKQVTEFFKGPDTKEKTREERQQQYHDDVILNYADTVRDVFTNSEHAMMPELNTMAGQTASVGAATAPFWSKALLGKSGPGMVVTGVSGLASRVCKMDFKTPYKNY
jgi:hypothetical protein